MTPKEKNEWKFGIIVFGPMIVIPVLLGAFGLFNIGTVILGAVSGILCGKFSLMIGFVLNEVPDI